MKNSFKSICAVLLLLSLHFQAESQGFQKKVLIKWNGVQNISGVNQESVKALCATGLSNNASRNYTPVYFEKFILPANAGSCDILLTHTEWEPISRSELDSLTYMLEPDDKLSPIVTIGTERGVKMAMLSVVPVVVNPEGGMMRLTSFILDLVYIPAEKDDARLKSSAFAEHSVLAEGDWYKIKLDQTGIYKISYAEIHAMGVDMQKVTAANIRLFGNGGGPLPESNSVFRYDDLTENPITVVSAIHGLFSAGDYILFYGTAPDKIFYNTSTHKFEHSKNSYSDFTYFYLNFDGAAGLRIEDQQLSTLAANYTCTSFTEGIFYENDLANLVKSGKDWVGERMDVNSPLFELPEYTFPNVKLGKQAWINFRVVARAVASTDFTVQINGKTVASPGLPAYPKDDFGTDKVELKSFFPDSEKINISFRYNGAGQSTGWLDWVELNIPRELKFAGGQMVFADPFSVMPGFVSDFQLQASSAAVTIWEITDPVHVKRVKATLQGDVSRFVLATDSLRQFIAWDNTSFLTAGFVEKVLNQDLHGIASADMLIITHNNYLGEANRLAEYHRLADGFKVEVVTNEQVYNEFSSGAPDIAALRDFARMLYQRPGEGSKLRYLLLFGDGSYDNKDRIPANTNRVLTFQTKESLSTVKSFPCDDFFGMLDAGEGQDSKGLIDIGIGRFPVNTDLQARIAVDKSLYYAADSEDSFGDWRNKLCFVADDGDQNTHFRQVEKDICPGIEAAAPVYNIEKIYMDAFTQISTPIGQRAPDVNTAINTAVGNGVLIMNYTGHGGEKGWADESILSVREIDAWTNADKLPVFFTATCEFSRYDDPVLMSAGEHVFLNPVGGGVALFSTTRLASAYTNVSLTNYFYDTLFSYKNGEYPRFGDAIASAKNKFFGYEVLYIRNFVLLGDPALQLAYPKLNVITTQINGHDPEAAADTISAMETVQINGIVSDQAGNKATDFDGIVDIKVFDKERTLSTLGTDPDDYPDTFTVQDNYIYQGRATVTNGDFSYEFIVPRDIDYSYGSGKLSYYAHNATTDANGFTKQIIIGGAGAESTDETGPLITLFINDLYFKDGGITGDTPLLIAQLSDESGISTVSNAIGHDIVATVDGDNSSSVVLNSFYSADLDSYRSGEVRYKLAQLTDGMHTLTLKAWDVFGNSSEASISFNVSKNIQISITDINVYPNPSSGLVKVAFDINLFDTPIEAHLEIFNINGSLVRVTESQLLLSNGYNAGILTWDGRTAYGNKAVPGVYLIAVKVASENSDTVKAVRVVRGL